MKSLLIGILILVTSITESYGQIKGNIESQNLITNGTIVPQINVYIQEPISQIPNLSWTGFTVTSKKWSEALVGFTYSPIKELTVSFSAGLETDNKPFRYSWGVWAGKYNLSVFSVYEQGGSGYWFKHIALYSPTSYVGIGVHWQRSKGIGPRVETTLFKKIKVWGSYLIGKEKNVGYAGLKILF